MDAATGTEEADGSEAEVITRSCRDKTKSVAQNARKRAMDSMEILGGGPETCFGEGVEGGAGERGRTLAR